MTIGQSAKQIVVGPQEEKEGKAGDREKEGATRMRPLSPVQGPNGQVRIAPGSIANYAPRKATRPDKVKRIFATEEMMIVAQVHQAVVIAMDVMKRWPGDGRKLRSQLAALTISGAEPCDDPPRVRAAAPTAAETSLTERVFAALIKFMQTEPLGTKLVVGRALGTPWKQLLAEDPEGRARSWLSYLRNNTLYAMREDIFPVDKEDKTAR